MNLDEFYQGILERLHAREVPCAITGGLACVQFGVAEHTEDCDLLCAPDHAKQLLEVLRQTSFDGAPCRYRGTLSAPLDGRWLEGGWTGHFAWDTGGTMRPYLDVFGVPPRMSSPWTDETQGSWAGRHTVAEMKRTNRRKDWDQATAIGIQLLHSGDQRGWLHIFDADALLELARTIPCEPLILAQRPSLKLAFDRDARLSRVVQTEVDFWTHLNRLRLKIYEAATRPYAAALRAGRKSEQDSLYEQHVTRLIHAEELLPMKPLHDHGIDRLIAEARDATARGLLPELLNFLPDATLTLRWLR